MLSPAATGHGRAPHGSAVLCVFATGLFAAGVLAPDVLAAGAAGAPSPVLASAAPPGGEPRAVAAQVPPEFAAIAVASGLSIDGARSDIARVSSGLSIEAAVDTWRRWWAAAGTPARESRAHGWRVLSRPGAGGLVTVQLRAAAGGGSEGFVSALRAPADSRPAGESGLPLVLPAGARVLRTVVAADGARLGTQAVVAMSGSRRAAVARLARAAEASGWTSLRLAAVPAGATRTAAADDRVHWYRRGADELALFAGPAPADSGADAVVVVHHLRVVFARAVAR